MRRSEDAGSLPFEPEKYGDEVFGTLLSGDYTLKGAYHLGYAPEPEAVGRPGGHVSRPGPDELAKVYVEVTTRCNLSCRTCVRNAWDEPLGTMPLELFDELLKQLEGFPKPLTVFFGGYGEPLVHRELAEMIRRVKRQGARVELITNGMLLTREMIAELIDLAVDKIWVSIDGMSPERYADIRRGGELSAVKDAVERLHGARLRAGVRLPAIGLAFVALRSNLAELPELYRLACYVHAAEVMVSNILPHTEEMIPETLYRVNASLGPYGAPGWPPRLSLPRIDINPTTAPMLAETLRATHDIFLLDRAFEERLNYCPFVLAGSTAIRWDGQVSPCLPLLHSHPEYVVDRWRQVRHASFGRIAERSLVDIWLSEPYRAFRRRVRDFDFSPCTICGGCHYSESNEEDCIGNTFPTCGGCLWAQGILQCP